MKYITVKVSGIITQIAKPTEIPGYSEGVLEIFFPEDEEMKDWTKEDEGNWIKENNERMQSICDFLNRPTL